MTTGLFSKSVSWTIILFCLPLFFAYCKSSRSNSLDKRNLDRWFHQETWLGGLRLSPHRSINKVEFSRQYQKDSTWWIEAFDFLNSHNLEELPVGRYIIDSGNVIAMVSDLIPRPEDSTNWEAHRNFNDLQYIIRGKVKMGVVPISDPSAKVLSPYNAQDNETFLVGMGKYFEASPGSFFIFSPREIHQPAFRIDNNLDKIKKVVIKVRVPQ